MVRNDPRPALLQMEGMTKAFPGVQALSGVDLTLERGEILAVLGENGAGKSTLMKILGGALRADAGTIRIDGERVELHSPRAARLTGIALIHQELQLVPALNAVENIFLGQELTVRWGWIDRVAERRRAAEILNRLGVDIELDCPCGQLTTAKQQLVEIARALVREARILVMDEPTAALTLRETEKLFEVMAQLKRQGLGIVYISHRLDEIFRIADRVTFLRDGTHVGSSPIAELTRQTMIEKMVGRTLDTEFPTRHVTIGEPRFIVSGLARGEFVRNVSFELRRGEIVALTGLVGAGRTETARLLFGADQSDAGTITLDGRTLSIHSPRDAIAARIGLLTESRKEQGLVLAHAAIDNFILPNLQRLSTAGFLRPRLAFHTFAQYVQKLSIRVAQPAQPVGNLSGGNQQKIVLAKWLARECDILIFDEPTRGIDVGAKYEIYQLMNELVAAGKSILMISSELPEVLGMADRILVMHAGQIVGEFAEVKKTSQEDVMRLAVGREG